MSSSTPVYRHTVRPEEPTVFIDMNTITNNGDANYPRTTSTQIAENKKLTSKFRTLVICFKQFLQYLFILMFQ